MQLQFDGEASDIPTLLANLQSLGYLAISVHASRWKERDLSTGQTIDRGGRIDVELVNNPPDSIELRRLQATTAYKQLTALRNMTPDQAEAWVQTNVTDLASAKSVMKIFARLLVILARTGDLGDL